MLLDHCLDALDGISWQHYNADGLSLLRANVEVDVRTIVTEGVATSTTSRTKDQAQGGLLGDLIVFKCSAVFELFTSEETSLIVDSWAFFVFDHSLHSLDHGSRNNFMRDGLAGQRLDENLHLTARISN